MLKRRVKSIAHGPASSHGPGPTEMWGRSTACCESGRVPACSKYLGNGRRLVR
jgi:hypothetical protein